MNLEKKYIFLFMLILFAVRLQALTHCRYCGYTLNEPKTICPNCLRKLAWPLTPPRKFRAKVIVREGKDAFIRSRYAQNKYWQADKNAGADTYGPVGSWGEPTSLRYLIKFNIFQAFKDAQINLKKFNISKARIVLRACHNKFKGKIFVVAYMLQKPFTEGTGKIRVRQPVPTGCTWFVSSPLIPWEHEGGDYDKNICGYGVITSIEKYSKIDVTDILKYMLGNYKKYGFWNNPGFIIMRDISVYSNCNYLNIYSFDSAKLNKKIVLTPELYIE